MTPVVAGVSPATGKLRLNGDRLPPGHLVEIDR
jgi:hypothetical protein